MGWINEKWRQMWDRRRPETRHGGWTLNPVFGNRENAPAGRLDCRPVCYVWTRGALKGWFVRFPL